MSAAFYLINSKPWQVVFSSIMAQMVKNQPAMQETWARSPGREDPLEEGMATHSSIVAWRIPWTEEPGGLQSMESPRARHNWVTITHITLEKPKTERADTGRQGFTFRHQFLKAGLLAASYDMTRPRAQGVGTERAGRNHHFPKKTSFSITWQYHKIQPTAFLFLLFVCLWLCWVFVAAHGLSVAVADGGSSLIAVLSPRGGGFSSCGAGLRAQVRSAVRRARGPTACGIFREEAANQRPLCWQGDSQPLDHRGGPHSISW